MRCPFCKHDDTRVTDSRATDDGRAIRHTLAQEVPSVKIGEMVLCELKSIDAVAYIRFASVYRQFADLDSFMAELKSLMGNNNNA